MYTYIIIFLLVVLFIYRNDDDILKLIHYTYEERLKRSNNKDVNGGIDTRHKTHKMQDELESNLTVSKASKPNEKQKETKNNIHEILEISNLLYIIRKMKIFRWNYNKEYEMI